MLSEVVIDQPVDILLVVVLPFSKAHSNPSGTQSGNITPALQDNAIKYPSIDMYMAPNQKTNPPPSYPCANVCDSCSYRNAQFLWQR
jgi:hypothetical protein